VSDAQNIANMIVRTGEDSPQEQCPGSAARSQPPCPRHPVATGRIGHAAGFTATVRPTSGSSAVAHDSPLACFQPVVEELLVHPMPDNYLEYLRLKLSRIAPDKTASAEVQENAFSDDR
jgi:hypothetical protein